MAELDPAVQRRRLTVTLKHLRNELDLTRVHVAQALDWSPSKVVRIEHGDVGISRTDLLALLRYYKVTDEKLIEELIGLARGSRQQRFAAFSDVLSKDFLRFLGYEVAASRVYQFQPLIIPGLLQTDDYMTAVFRSFNPQEPEERINRRALARTQRQELLYRENCPELNFILDEAVLRRVAGAGMLDQLVHIRTLGARTGINIQVVRYSSGIYPGMIGPFVLLEFPDAGDDSLLYLENTLGEISTRDAKEDIAIHFDRFYRLADIATSPKEIDSVVAEIIRDLERSGPEKV